ncbi:MAG: type II toxin-antitoxin system RelE/ParE family toxin [Pseudonocardia sp.]|nr:type II toxin-antitoxin system RelE/ParE family toxin [Pseudonocardia sp.]
MTHPDVDLVTAALSAGGAGDSGHCGGPVRDSSAHHRRGDGGDHGEEVGPRRGVRYSLRLSRAARKSLAETSPEGVAAAVWEFISGPLLDNPHRVGKSLRFELDGYHSARRGQYCVIYRIDEHEVIIDVIKISHRSDAYG